MHFFTHNEAFALKMWHAFGSNFRETHSLRSLVNVSSVHVNSFPDVVSILLCAPVLLHLSPTTYCHFHNSRTPHHYLHPDYTEHEMTSTKRSFTSK